MHFGGLLVNRRQRLGREIIDLDDFCDCLVRGDGTVWCRGSDGAGQLGDGKAASRDTFGLVPGLDHVRDVAIDYDQVVALRDDGTLMYWGLKRIPGPFPHAMNSAAQRAPTPAPVDHVTSLVSPWVQRLDDGSIAVRRELSWSDVAREPLLAGVLAVTSWDRTKLCACQHDRQVACWDAGPPGVAPTLVPDVADVAALGAGNAGPGVGNGRVCAVTRTGEVWCWDPDRNVVRPPFRVQWSAAAQQAAP